MEILADFQPFDPVGAARVMLRAASADNKRITAASGNRWWPAILRKPTLRHDWFDGDFTGAIRNGGASLTVAMFGLKRQNANAGRFQWSAAPVSLYEIDPAVGTPVLIFKGLVDSFRGEDETLTLDLRVDTTPFEASALTLTYAGTGGVEGGADLKGQVKPWCFGRAKNVEPVLINAVDSVYQISAYGPIQGVTTLYERASSFGASVGNFADYAALLAASIPAGRWGTCNSLGLVRLGAPAAGVLTADVDGDVSGSWLRRTGEIINRICTNAGISAGLIDSASLSALDTAMTALCPTNQGRINLYLTEQIRIIDLVQTLARPCNAAAGVSMTGQLFVSRTVIGTPGMVLDVQGRRLPPVAGADERSVSPPYWRLQVGADRCWRVHRPDEIAFYSEIIERGDYAGATTYREGNIVVNQGARWIYTNTTPTSGNAPPTLPTSSNSFWSLLSGQTDFATLTGGTKPADNATRNDDGFNMIPSPVTLDQFWGGGLVVREENAPSGGGAGLIDQYRMKFTGNGFGGWTNRTTIEGLKPFRVVPGERMTMRAQLFRDAAASNIELRYQSYDNALNDLGPTTIFTHSSPTNAWITCEATFTVPSGVAYVWPHIVSTSGTNFGGNGYLGRAQPGSTFGAPTRRSIEQMVTGGVTAAYDTNPVSASTTGSTSAVAIAAHTVADDVGSISYAGGSITGLSPNTNYYVYDDDPRFQGGTRSYVATTNFVALAAPGRRYVGFVKTPATSGGTATGGGSGGGGGSGSNGFPLP
jgi:hypothetical protein